ncbi:MAG: hypothetical protein FWF82_00535 [Oscillospiraceae bacterium]|nr:hypothetical protein [Oscillospiraceae bacterium]
MKFKDSSKNLSNYYIIDTGATCTTINRVQLHKLGYDDNWIRSTGEKLPENECPILADKRRATD